MPHLAIGIDPFRGPLIKLFVGVSASRGAAMTAAGVAVPPPITVDFLVDTGATSLRFDCVLMLRRGCHRAELYQHEIAGFWNSSKSPLDAVKCYYT